MSSQDLDNRFNYHKPDESKAVRHQNVRYQCLGVASAFDTLLPDGREKALALTKLEEAMFWANAAIAREPVPDSVT